MKDGITYCPDQGTVEYKGTPFILGGNRCDQGLSRAAGIPVAPALCPAWRGIVSICQLICGTAERNLFLMENSFKCCVVWMFIHFLLEFSF